MRSLVIKDEEDVADWPRSESPGSLRHFIVNDGAEEDNSEADEDLPVVDLNAFDESDDESLEIVEVSPARAAKPHPKPIAAASSAIVPSSANRARQPVTTPGQGAGKRAKRRVASPRTPLVYLEDLEPAQEMVKRKVPPSETKATPWNEKLL